MIQYLRDNAINWLLEESSLTSLTVWQLSRCIDKMNWLNCCCIHWSQSVQDILTTMMIIKIYLRHSLSVLYNLLFMNFLLNREYVSHHCHTIAIIDQMMLRTIRVGYNSWCRFSVVTVSNLVYYSSQCECNICDDNYENDIEYVHLSSDTQADSSI